MDIEGLATQAGLEPVLGGLKDGDDVWIECDVLGGLERFALLIVTAEREACAKVCDELKDNKEFPDGWGPVSKACARLIRERSNPK